MHKVLIDYTNWQGVRRPRIITPIDLHFGNNEWHKKDQWLLEARDEETGQIRFIALANIHSWKQMEES